MQFKKMKLLTGLVSISMAAAMAGVPVLAAETTGNNERATLQTTEEVAQVELTSNNQISESSSQNNPIQFDQTNSDDLAEASSLLVDGAVSSISASASETRMTDARNEALTTIVGTTHLAVNTDEKELVVAAPTEYLNIHNDASLSSDVVGKLYSNDVAKVLHDDGGDWVKIESGGVVGYVLSDYFVKGDEAKMLTELVGTNIAMVNSDSEDNTKVRIRRSENNRSRTVATISKGDQVTVLDDHSDNGWLKVSTESGVTGYVQSDDVTVGNYYPSAESSESYEERTADATPKQIVDDAKEKAESAQAIADVAAQKAEEAQNTVNDENTEASAAQLKEAEIAQSVAESTAQTAENTQKVAETIEEGLQTRGSKAGQAVADFALQFVGNPYVWGGSSLTHGTDCSGFTMAVYANFGVSLPHYDASQRGYGIAINSLADAMPGDLICYYGHVGIYIGDGMLVHAANARDGIKVSRADYRSIAAIRRIFY